MNPLPDVSLGSDEPLYNIGVVARMTGVSMATLRAWERRYDFPDAERTPGGHRLYSERDVLRLRWVKERIGEGMQTSQAIQALRHQEQVGNLTLVEQTPMAHVERGADAQPHMHSFEAQLYKLMVDRDLRGADTMLAEALAVISPEDLVLNVIGPVLTSIGDAWENGKISVATEHLATNYLRQRLLMWMVGGPPPRSIRPIALACAPDEWHEGSLLVLGALLRRRRWPVAYLGQALPLEDLATFVRDIRPSLVVLVAMMEETVNGLMDWPEYLPEAAQSGKPAIAFGGRAFVEQPEWINRLPGTYLGDTYSEGLANIERLLTQAL
jgi:DNA-binding transcriptional MerR regulator